MIHMPWGAILAVRATKNSHKYNDKENIPLVFWLLPLVVLFAFVAFVVIVEN